MQNPIDSINKYNRCS